MNGSRLPPPGAENPRRFVVLQHTDKAGIHFDLMIDLGPDLATWKFAQPPEAAANGSLPCQRIGNHRHFYLDYEGPISGGRGHVVRHDAGECTALTQVDLNCLVRFFGEKLSGRFQLKSADATGGAFWFEAVLD